ncbi:alpha/beta fold hydrolase [Candidatus Nitrospira bockiana]
MIATINGVELAYTDEGRGIPIVFLHAFPLSRAMWDPQRAALSRRCRVIALDLRGHGESAPLTGPFTLDDLADDVNGLLAHLSIPQAVLAGLSMGGYVAFAFCRRHAARLKALILADTRAQADTPEGREGRFKMIEAAETRGPEAVAEEMLPKLLSPKTRDGRPDLVARVRSIILGTPVATIAADLKAMAARPDSTPMLATIACPTLVLVGEEDRATPPSDARLMAAGIPGARLVTIPEAAHLANVEAPDRFNDAVASFLQEIG